MSEFEYDLFIIGGGSGGVRAARWAAKKGLRVGLAERVLPKMVYIFPGSKLREISFR